MKAKLGGGFMALFGAPATGIWIPGERRLPGRERFNRMVERAILS